MIYNVKILSYCSKAFTRFSDFHIETPIVEEFWRFVEFDLMYDSESLTIEHQTDELWGIWTFLNSYGVGVCDFSSFLIFVPLVREWKLVNMSENEKS